MTSMTQQATTAFAARRHNFATTAFLVVLFWIPAALLVSWMDGVFLRPLAACVVAKTIAIVAVAWMYVQLTAREASVEHAIAVGISWLLLAVICELAITEFLGHPWFHLLGRPEPRLAHNLIIVVWLAAPALFARVSTLDER